MSIRTNGSSQSVDALRSLIVSEPRKESKLSSVFQIDDAETMQPNESTSC